MFCRKKAKNKKTSLCPLEASDGLCTNTSDSDSHSHSHSNGSSRRSGECHTKAPQVATDAAMPAVAITSDRRKLDRCNRVHAGFVLTEEYDDARRSFELPVTDARFLSTQSSPVSPASAIPGGGGCGSGGGFPLPSPLSLPNTPQRCREGPVADFDHTDSTDPGDCPSRRNSLDCVGMYNSNKHGDSTDSGDRSSRRCWSDSNTNSNSNININKSNSSESNININISNSNKSKKSNKSNNAADWSCPHSPRHAFMDANVHSNVPEEMHMLSSFTARELNTQAWSMEPGSPVATPTFGKASKNGRMGPGRLPNNLQCIISNVASSSHLKSIQQTSATQGGDGMLPSLASTNNSAYCTSAGEFPLLMRDKKGLEKSLCYSSKPSPLPSPRASKVGSSHHPISFSTNNEAHPLPLPPSAIMSSPVSPCCIALPLSPGRAEPLVSTRKWIKGNLLGKGSFGSVYRGIHSETGDMCAIKEVELASDDQRSKESALQLQKEIELLSCLRHPNIVHYKGSEMIGDFLYIYLELVSEGTLYKLLQEYRMLEESVIRCYTRQILLGLKYLHENDIVHRDIKAANILIDQDGIVKLADFGTAKNITEHAMPLSFKGSPYWMAPEVIMQLNTGYQLAVDIWSLGCTVIEMATGKPPWSEYEGVAAMFKVTRCEAVPIPESMSPNAKDFLRCCLRKNPAERPTAAELLNHPFLHSPLVDYSDNRQGAGEKNIHAGTEITWDSKIRPCHIIPGDTSKNKHVMHPSASCPASPHSGYNIRRYFTN